LECMKCGMPVALVGTGKQPRCVICGGLSPHEVFSLSTDGLIAGDPTRSPEEVFYSAILAGACLWTLLLGAVIYSLPWLGRALALVSVIIGVLCILADARAARRTTGEKKVKRES
jgi:hypothetical protein